MTTKLSDLTGWAENAPGKRDGLDCCCSDFERCGCEVDDFNTALSQVSELHEEVDVYRLGALLNACVGKEIGTNKCYEIAKALAITMKYWLSITKPTERSENKMKDPNVHILKSSDLPKHDNSLGCCNSRTLTMRHHPQKGQRKMSECEHKNKQRKEDCELCPDCGGFRPLESYCWQFPTKKALPIEQLLARQEATTQLRELDKKHGMYGTRFYKLWGQMIQRATNPKRNRAHLYLGKGISVCDEWRLFNNFKNDMLPSYLDHVNKHGENQTTLDRIDSDKGYFLGNCRWATKSVQRRNTKTFKTFEYNGVSLCMTDWSKIFEIPLPSLWEQVNDKNVPLKEYLNTRFGTSSPTVEKIRDTLISRGFIYPGIEIKKIDEAISNLIGGKNGD